MSKRPLNTKQLDTFAAIYRNTYRELINPPINNESIKDSKGVNTAISNTTTEQGHNSEKCHDLR